MLAFCSSGPYCNRGANGRAYAERRFDLQTRPSAQARAEEDGMRSAVHGDHDDQVQRRLP